VEVEVAVAAGVWVGIRRGVEIRRGVGLDDGTESGAGLGGSVNAAIAPAVGVVSGSELSNDERTT
jgi:hypothetical protein